ncbi:MAG: ATP-binding protein [Campylobacterota bacterium]|nr:ATP-binding protein [Campylobacterota bacterium]
MELRFDFADDDTTTGFRLKEFELYNWGTYDKKVVKLSLNKQNGLLTGDIGSGKSTIVDALTTLLVPHQKITFNKAAGAESKERSLRSYILGEYKSSQDETFKNAKAVALRDESSFSVLLARFENDGFEESYSIAQFFFIANKQVQKFFISSKGALSIKKDFLESGFKDIRQLKKELRSKEHTEVYDSFSAYAKDFKRSMGIKNDQALNLFYQTVSLKAIGNLTNFVREHMLESSDIDTKIDELCKNFAELNHSHNLVLRAKEQIELLMPVDREGRVYEKLLGSKHKREEMRDALPSYFSVRKISLLETKLEELKLELEKTSSKKMKTDERLGELNSSEVDLRVELQKNGGDRIKSLEEQIQRAGELLAQKKNTNTEYNSLAKSLELPVVSNEHRFLKNANESREKFENIEVLNAKHTNEIIINESAKKRYEEKIAHIESEISYLQNNRSNIPKHISIIRDTMAESLGIELDALPFVGELLEVKDSEWQGAIERVMHSFSLSLLVNEEHYDRVSEYVNATHLGGKLVYLKVVPLREKKSFFESMKNSLLSKVEIKADSHFFETLQSMMQERFDIPCVESIAEFRKYKKALTKNGQFKSNYSRHEKDDRYEINDKKRWSLGWDNSLKLAAMHQELVHFDEKLEYLNERIEESQKASKLLVSQRDDLRDILKYGSFSEIDWYEQAKKIEVLNEELSELQKSSDILESIQKSLDRVTLEIKELTPKREEYSKTLGGLESKIESFSAEVGELLEQEEVKEALKEAIQKFFGEHIKEKLTLVNIAAKERELHATVQKEIEKIVRKVQTSTAKILQQMNLYTNSFVVESQEFDASLESLNDFRAKLTELKKDDLPRFEKRFKELFKEKTIQKTAMIQAELEHHAKEIQEKIEKINDSLKSIEYNDGTYISLIAEPSNIREIREFKQELKSAISYAISDDNSYDEAKFLQIKELIDRFNGRENYSEVDRRWRSLVSDVRNWFDFSASEKYVSDGSEKEYYAHSGGKSGGQKEKLAYTVLASSLAFQFGLEYNEVRSRSFRFVMIDEAFGKGSDESTKYALRLFEKLNLQLLVITPKTKINVIEPFVKSVHFVHNQDGMNSSLLSMSIDEYQKNKGK